MKSVLNLGMTPIPVPMALQNLEKAKTKTTRKKIIRALWDNDDEEIFLGLEVSMDDSIDFMVNSVPLWDIEDDMKTVLDFNLFYQFCMNVKYKKLSKKDIENKILELANMAGSNEWNKFYRLIILKKLHTTLNLSEFTEVIKDIKTEMEKNKDSDVNIRLTRRK